MRKFLPNVDIITVTLGAATLLGIMFLLLQGAFLAKAGSPLDAVVSIGFAISTLIAFIMSGGFIITWIMQSAKFKHLNVLMDNTTDTDAISFEFFLGFLLFSVIGFMSTQFSVFKFAILDSTSSIILDAANVVGGVNTYWGNFIVTIASPLSEELVFMGAFFGVAIMFFTLFGEQLKASGRVGKFFGRILTNVWAQTLLAAPLIAITFAAFHVGQAGATQFFIAAFVFRFLILILVTDSRKNFIPYITAGLTFAVGGHIANNILASAGSYQNWVSIMLTASQPLEIVTALLVGMTFMMVIVGTYNFTTGLLKGRIRA